MTLYHFISQPFTPRHPSDIPLVHRNPHILADSKLASYLDRYGPATEDEIRKDLPFFQDPRVPESYLRQRLNAMVKEDYIGKEE